MGRSVHGSTARADTKSKHLVDKYSRTCRARPFLDRKGERTVVSERKLEANRRNAKRSTGPKDTRRTRLNAQKHGLLSKEATIKNGAAKADQRELDSLREALREDPEGTMKEILIERITFCAWFQRRAHHALMGVIIRAAGSTVASDRPSAARRCDLLLKAVDMSSVSDSRDDSRATN